MKAYIAMMLVYAIGGVGGFIMDTQGVEARQLYYLAGALTAIFATFLSRFFEDAPKLV